MRNVDAQVPYREAELILSGNRSEVKHTMIHVTVEHQELQRAQTDSNEPIRTKRTSSPLLFSLLLIETDAVSIKLNKKIKSVSAFKLFLFFKPAALR